MNFTEAPVKFMRPPVIFIQASVKITAAPVNFIGLATQTMGAGYSDA